ncbi:DEAD/DEAH box helicase family protein [Kordiimonas lacus]|uniref:Helicase conserved C-terminal domain-containing protein n=1 Tax=Kordiimonas lacus TaxID=637679 RepID=A0A1G7E0Q1_9PROT|nr:DEAD/DEAH box helicase family protein [Kordiimonas lacus]SDE57232.1 Helicase conserved C-terminal domain-containing protein [Kordiimonas lacus]
MKGYSREQLGRIDVELKEAICDSLVNTLTARVGGTDERGKIVYGRSPHRAIFAGQLMPRFGAAGDDETSDIRIATIGLDFAVGSDSKANISISPKFSVYVRVLPNWSELAASGGGLEFDFKLNSSIQKQIEQRIRENRQTALKAAGLDRPAWNSLSETERAEIRAKRNSILEEVRRSAFAEHNIELEQVEASSEVLPEAFESQDTSDEGEADDVTMQPVPIDRLIRDGRGIPLTLIDPAPIPGKWKRIDLTLPILQFCSDDELDALEGILQAYNKELSQVVGEQLDAWLNSEGASIAWRNVQITPAQTQTEKAWLHTLKTLEEIPAVRGDVLPDLSEVCVKVERQQEFIDPSRISLRISLDNQSTEMAVQEAQRRCNTIFGTELCVTLPIDAHRPLQLDRVEPSYRFRDYMGYPAIGLNCGVSKVSLEDCIELRTNISPRFVQPRIIPRHVSVPTQFSILSDPAFEVETLRRLPEEYSAWIDQQEKRLSPIVGAGLDHLDSAREADRLAQDLQAQRAEVRYIERGIELLIASRKYAQRLDGGVDQAEKASLEALASPWRAWLMMNQSFASRDKQYPERGWRLFQMAFILAHVPVFASRMKEWREYFDKALSEDCASLLYFPTGGGKSEAFYGSLIFALFIDRLRGKDRGITALIRYPLRLLTLQQAQRLLKLLVHVELVRRNNKVGHWPFEIGFWVGGQNTPNRYSAFRSEIPRIDDPAHPDDHKLLAPSTEDQADSPQTPYGESLEAYNKVPDCPVCGEKTGIRRDERDGPMGKRAAIVCFNDRCDWNRAHGTRHPLPFLLTDDTIYARAPSIVLGTVDKLAMLGQSVGTIANVLGMFGMARWMDAHGNLSSPRNEEALRAGPEASGLRPVFPAYQSGEKVFLDPFPSLVIQDEAHLLEESLGTFSGLFDTLLENIFHEINDLAGEQLQVSRVWDENHARGPRMPKIIAATATISAPEKQLETLYQRQPLRFPYPGPDIYHSFFSEPAHAPGHNKSRVDLESSLPSHLTPETTAPWMRLYVSLITNGATHTVTTVNVLAIFHSIITEIWDKLLSKETRQKAMEELRDSCASDLSGSWRRAAIERAIDENRYQDILALIDLHRIALAYVTNKKGGDQIMDALGAAVEQQHRVLGRSHVAFDSRLISGGVDMKEIQAIMEDAEASLEDKELPDITSTLRNIVATSAISHGVDVDRFNSMFFAGLPTDVAEYIQASSRVGRTHVGFVMLLPTPQNRRDRYVVETHDIFHRFLERMISSPAVERWAENAIKRTLASHIQAWVMLEEIKDFFARTDSQKSASILMDQVSRLSSMAKNGSLAFRDNLGDFILRSIGFQGHGPNKIGAPHYADFYSGMIEKQVDNFVQDLSKRNVSGTLVDYWEDLPALQKPMTSLRDVDEAGYIVAAGRDPQAASRKTDINRSDLAEVMRTIRTQRGFASDLDAEGGANG